MTDREEREKVIEILQKEKKTALHDNRWAFDYAIASIKTDLKYDLLYEETSGQADKPTTKNDLGVDYLGLVTPQEPRWIPVSERLPNFAGVYRVTRYYPNNVMNPNYLVDACFFDGSNTWHNDNRINHERGYANNIIAWQENPEPYKFKPQESEE